MMQVFIAPHERHEGLEAYADWLNKDQKEQIEEADEDAIICLTRDGTKTVVTIILEG